MIIDNQVATRVLLPTKLWEQAKDQVHLKNLIVDYLRNSYPNYRVQSVKDGFAICTKS